MMKPLVAGTNGKIVIINSAKLLILIGGLAIITHQLWLHIANSSEQVIEKPKNWQQFLSLIATFIGGIFVVLLILDYGYLKFDDRLVFHIIRISGIVAFYAGWIFRLWALNSLGKNYAPDLRIKEGGTLTTNGAYSFVRHPFYLSIMLFVYGASLALTNFLVLMVAILISIVIRHRIKIEEIMLQSYFSDVYTQYCKNVPMLFPKIRREKSQDNF